MLTCANVCTGESNPRLAAISTAGVGPFFLFSLFSFSLFSFFSFLTFSRFMPNTAVDAAGESFFFVFFLPFFFGLWKAAVCAAGQ
jgi:hypothetical protein